MEAADAAADEQLFLFFHFVLTIFPFCHFGVYVQCPPPPNYSGFVDFWRTVSKIFRVSPCDLEQKNVLENVDKFQISSILDRLAKSHLSKMAQNFWPQRLGLAIFQ